MANIDTRSIIINLLKEDKKVYLSISRLQKLLMYIYEQLLAEEDLGQYNICFDINFDAIERTVLYNNNIFQLDFEGRMIYLRKTQNIDSLAEKYQTCDKISELIRSFCNAA